MPRSSSSSSSPSASSSSKKGEKSSEKKQQKKTKRRSEAAEEEVDDSDDANNNYKNNDRDEDEVEQAEQPKVSKKNASTNKLVAPEVADKAKAKAKLRMTAEMLLSLLVAKLPYETVGERTKLTLFEAIVKNIDHGEITKCIESDLQHFFLHFEKELDKLKAASQEEGGGGLGNGSSVSGMAMEEKPLVFADLRLSTRTVKYLCDRELERFILRSVASASSPGPNSLSPEAVLAMVVSNLKICVEIAPVLMLNCRNLAGSGISNSNSSSNSNNSNNSSNNKKSNNNSSNNNSISNSSSSLTSSSNQTDPSVISRGICHILLDRLCLNSAAVGESSAEVACILAFSLFTPGVSYDKLHAVTSLMTRLNPNIVAYLIGLIGYFGNALSEAPSCLALSVMHSGVGEGRVGGVVEQYLDLIEGIAHRASSTSVPACVSYSSDMKSLLVASVVLCFNWIAHKASSTATTSSSTTTTTNQGKVDQSCTMLASILKHIVGNSNNSKSLFSSFIANSALTIEFNANYKSVSEFITHMASSNSCVKFIMERFQGELSIDDLLQSFDKGQEEEEEEELAEEEEDVDENVDESMDITFEIDSKSAKASSSSSISVLDSYLGNNPSAGGAAGGADKSIEDAAGDSLAAQVEAALEEAKAPTPAASKRSSKTSSSSSSTKESSSENKGDNDDKKKKRGRLEETPAAPAQNQVESKGSKKSKK